MADILYSNLFRTSFRNSTELKEECSSNIRRCLHLEAVSTAVYWKYSLFSTVPGTYLTSTSTSSPGFLSALMYLYLIFFTLYFLVNPSSFKIFPIVLTGTANPCLANLQ